jgi:glucose 1-dehydrogenase
VHEPGPPAAPGAGTRADEGDRLRDLLRSRAYQKALVFSALIGVPVSLCAFWFLAALHELVDTSFFPSTGAVNPSLTAMANALRVGDHLVERLSRPSRGTRLRAGEDPRPVGATPARDARRHPSPVMEVAPRTPGHGPGDRPHSAGGAIVSSPADTPRDLIPAPLLRGQKALVTGANSGIGRATALAMGRAGADVFVNYVADREETEKVVEEIRSFGVRAMAHEADVSDEDQVVAMTDRMVEEFGTIDILVANAGLQRDAPFTEMTFAQWQKVIDVNLTGQFLCAREATKEFLRRGVVPEVSHAAGKIICMSSVHQTIPWAGHVNYAASKGGVHMMMQTLAQELAPKKIRVNAIAPGAVRTPINRAAWETPEARDELLKLIPYDRVGDPEDIARAAVALASDLMDYVVGATLYVDGGMTLFPGFATGG